MYSAVIPRWINSMIDGVPCEIFGDGENSRDFCYVENVVRANILAAICDTQSACGQVFNITMGGSTSLKELHQLLASQVSSNFNRPVAAPKFLAPRPGDILSSRADISKAKMFLGYSPVVSFSEGISRTVEWYISQRTSPVSVRQMEV
jgi:UDP-N-acetylglucosamine/UDP-N-acetylgalactosamine 4-epimerase